MAWAEGRGEWVRPVRTPVKSAIPTPLLAPLRTSVVPARPGASRQKPSRPHNCGCRFGHGDSRPGRVRGQRATATEAELPRPDRARYPSQAERVRPSAVSESDRAQYPSQTEPSIRVRPSPVTERSVRVRPSAVSESERSVRVPLTRRKEPLRVTPPRDRRRAQPSPSTPPPGQGRPSSSAHTPQGSPFRVRDHGQAQPGPPLLCRPPPFRPQSPPGWLRRQHALTP